MFVRKTRAGSTATHAWPHDGAVVEVPDDLGAELLAIPDGGFTEVRPGDEAPDADAGAPADVAGLKAEIDGLRTYTETLSNYVTGELDKFRDALQALTAAGTAAPAVVSPPSGGSAIAAGVGPAGAGPPDGPTEPAAGAAASRRPAGSKAPR